MWADNETAVDLLGFDYLVDELEILLTEPRLLPVTVGVAGDWGSGKSSLMGMARERLESGANENRFVCVSFNPWRFEDYHDVKTALMTAVIDEIEKYVAEHEGLTEKAGELVAKVRQRITDWGVLKPAALAAGGMAGLGPEESAALAAAVAGAAGGNTDKPQDAKRAYDTIAHFHEEFGQLVDALGDEVQAVVVFIDDVDRCTTDTVVSTFEAIRLFLNAPKTAYAVGAHTEIVEAALEGRYPARLEGDRKVGHHYLEKMLQHAVPIPPLSEPEAQTYINLLFIELYADPEVFRALRQLAEDNRSKDQLVVAMNAGIARSNGTTLGDDLTQALNIAESIGPPLVRGLRGNPRQLKRFLNRFQRRRHVASKRAMELDPASLAKLMVLEELHPTDFEQLFHWQLEADGAPEKLAVAEKVARGENVEDIPEEVEAWLAQPGVRNWLRLDPALSGVVLGPYYTFSRDKLARLVGAARLPSELQQVLVGLQSDLEPARAAALGQARELEPALRAELLPVLIETALGDLGGAAAKSLLELAGGDEATATAMFTALDTLPPSQVSRNFPLALRVQFPGDPRLEPLFERWADEAGPAPLRAAVRAARKVR